MQRRNTLILLCEIFIKYQDYRSQNKIINTSADCSLRKKTFVIIFFSIHTVRPNMILIILFDCLFFLSVQTCYNWLYFELPRTKSYFFTKFIFEQNLCVEIINIGNFPFIYNVYSKQ